MSQYELVPDYAGLKPIPHPDELLSQVLAIGCALDPVRLNRFLPERQCDLEYEKEPTHWQLPLSYGGVSAEVCVWPRIDGPKATLYADSGRAVAEWQFDCDHQRWALSGSGGVDMHELIFPQPTFRRR